MESGARGPYCLQLPEWLVFLRTVCAFAEGNAELVNGGQQHELQPAAILSSVLGDWQRRIAIMGGRKGMARSLGSVYGSSVTRFLSGFRGGMPRAIATPGLLCYGGGIAVSRDGGSILVSDRSGGSHAVHVFSVHTGAFIRMIGGHGEGPLQFRHPCQVCVASDDFVFVADWRNNRIQVLTPQYDFHAFVGASQLFRPRGVCANEEVVVVSVTYSFCLSVFGRGTGSLLRRFECEGSCTRIGRPLAGLCFMPGHSNVAVANMSNNCVSVWSLEGKFVCDVGVGKIESPTGVACSDAGELVVADWLRQRIVVFDSSGGEMWTFKTTAVDSGWNFTSVTMHGNTIIGQVDGMCYVFS